MIEAKNVLKQWGEAVGRRSCEDVLACYRYDAVLVPTLWAEVCEGPKAIAAYFDQFLPRVVGPVQWVAEVATALDDEARIFSGIYRFELDQGFSEARYTFVVARCDEGWRIRVHHSSLLPNV